MCARCACVCLCVYLCVCGLTRWWNVNPCDRIILWGVPRCHLFNSMHCSSITAWNGPQSCTSCTQTEPTPERGVGGGGGGWETTVLFLMKKIISLFFTLLGTFPPFFHHIYISPCNLFCSFYSSCSSFLTPITGKTENQRGRNSQTNLYDTRNICWCPVWTLLYVQDPSLADVSNMSHLCELF